jgi:hypothetical protein
MTQSPQQAAVQSALQYQLSELLRVLDHVTSARETYLPVASTHWRGPARYAFDQGMEPLRSALDGAIMAVGHACDATKTAIWGIPGNE